MSKPVFKKNIEILDFSLIEKNKNEGSGVLLTDNFESLDKDIATPEVLFALETAKKFDADAVYFRYFNDGRGATPQIYIYDNTSERLTEKRRDIHIKIWSGCQVPMYIIIDKATAAVFDARERAEDDKENIALKTIELVGKAIKDFSALDLDDGLFWEEGTNKKHFQYEKSAFYYLIDGLKRVYKKFQDDSRLDSHVALKLLVQCLLIKYLEEGNEKYKSGYFTKKYFQNRFNCENFCGVIRAGKLLDLLDQLSADFNGKIFEWDKEGDVEVRAKLKRTEVKHLAEYLDGKSEGDQFVLWRLYSFSHLPVELISSVYEELLTNSEVASKDIVYTPEMIVSTLIDECMPLRNPQKDFKVIDVSCGSGIFLVKAYKRMIQWWRYERWKETGQLEKPSLKELKELLINNIYGVDINEDAVRLTVFSLALAMLDEVDLNPPLWKELKFPVLSEKTIRTQDFFEYITQASPNNFNLVIGNPPFNPPKDEKGKQTANKAYFKKLESDFGYSCEIKIPDQNVALHFCSQAMKLLRPGAILCLIQPSGPLLYQKDVAIKQAIFSKYNLLQIIDFTKLADVLWGKANVATAAVFLQKSKPDRDNVIHIVANKTFANVNRLFLEFDNYDFHNISKDDVMKNPYVWKANLLGGGRIINLIDRVSQLRRLRDFLHSKEEDGWKFGEGFIENKDGEPCNYITGKPFLSTKALTEETIEYEQIFPCDATNFLRHRNKSIYTPPHILIHANIGHEKLVVHLSDEYLVFRNKIIGIHAPYKYKGELEYLMQYFKDNSDLLRFFILGTSSQLKVSRYTVPMTEDFYDLPYPKNNKNISISKTEQILVKDVLEYHIKNDSFLLSKNSNDNQIKEFSKIFCKTLNSVYKTEKKSFRLYKIIDAGKYYAVHFEYTNKKYEPTLEVITNLEQYIEYIIPTKKKKGKSSHIQRIFKVYGKDTLILAKPKQLRYWLLSIALRDADEAFADYIKARYN